MSGRVSGLEDDPATRSPTEGALEAGAAETLSWYLVPRPLFRGGNQVELLRGGDQLFPAMIRAIARALRRSLSSTVWERFMK